MSRRAHAPDASTRTVTAGTDGSYWLTSTADAPPRPGLAGPTSADVCVVGAGISGLTSALLLARDGLSVQVIEAGAIGPGVSGSTTAKVTALHGIAYAELERDHGIGTVRRYAAANMRALDAIRDLVESENLACDWQPRSAVTYVTREDRHTALADEHDAARRAGLNVRMDDTTDLPFAVAGAIVLEDQAQFHPRRYLLALADLVERAGGRIAQDTRVSGVSGRGPYAVHTPTGDIACARVVLATHYPVLDRGLFFARMSVQRSYAIALELRGPEPEGMYFAAEEPSRSLRVIPRAGTSPLLLVGGEGHGAGREADGRRHARLESWARSTFDVGAVVGRWSAQDAIAADKLPYAGPVPFAGGGVHTITALRKWGLTNGTAAAAVVAALVQDRPHADAGLFSTTRCPGSAGVISGARENLVIGRHMIGDRVESHRHAHDAELLAPGEGAIVRLDGELVAGYCDDDGRLHAVSRTCTHLGCEVRFNPDERSWDCPCHGSRFGVGGEVLEGPATAPLEHAPGDTS